MQKISRTQYGLQQQILQTIYRLKDKKSSQLFRQPVNRELVKDYYDKIQHPMDLQTIAQKLKEGKYSQAKQVRFDLQLIPANCFKYNSQPAIVKKGQQFEQCINTQWSNFMKQLQKKGIDYKETIKNTEEIKKRLILLDQKKKKKKIPAQMAMLDNLDNPVDVVLLPRNSEIINEIKIQIKSDVPQMYQYKPEKYAPLTSQQKKQKLQLKIDHQEIDKEFALVSQRKLKKYRKILFKKVMWIEQKIIQRCLQKKRFKKMLIPNHLSNLIQNGQIANKLQLRKLQMYVKQVAYWVEQYSHILSDKMKDKFVNACRDIRRCVIRVLRYNKAFGKALRLNAQPSQVNPQSQMNQGQNLPQSHHQELPSAMNDSRFNQGQYSAFLDDQMKNYETKMKEFRRMIIRDRGQSTKKDTKIVLKILDNGDVIVHDWSAQNQQKKNQKRQYAPNIGGMFKDTIHQSDKTKQNIQKKQQIKKDQDFLSIYQKGSNTEVLLKYRDNLQIDWDTTLLKKYKNIQPIDKCQSQEFMLKFDFEAKTSQYK